MFPIVFFSITIASDWTQTTDWTALILSIGGLALAIALILIVPLILILVGFKNTANQRKDTKPADEPSKLSERKSSPGIRSALVRKKPDSSNRSTQDPDLPAPEKKSSASSGVKVKEPKEKAQKKTIRKPEKKATKKKNPSTAAKKKPTVTTSKETTKKKTPLKTTAEKPKKKLIAKEPAEKPKKRIVEKIAAEKAKKKAAKIAKKSSSNGKANTPGPKGTKVDPDLGLVYKKKPKDVDDLKEITGVGPVLEGKLHKTGVYTFSQVAKWSDKVAREFGERLSFRDRIFRDEWRKQAAKLHKKKYGKLS